MRKGRLAKIMAIGMVCSMAFLSACGKKDTVITEGGDRPAKEIDKDHIYSFENVDIPVSGNCSISRVCEGEDSLYAIAYVYSEDSMGSTKLFRMPFDTGMVEEVPLGDGTKNVSADNLTCDDDGNVYVVKYEYDMADSEDAVLYEADAEASSDVGETVSESGYVDAAATTSDEDVENASAGEAVAEDEATGYDAEDVSLDDITKLAKYSSDGTTIWETSLTETDADSYISSITYAKGLGVLTCSELGISLYDEATGEAKTIRTRERNEDGYYSGYLFRMRNDDIYLFEEDEGSGSVVSKLNAGNMTFEDAGFELPEGIYGAYELYPGKTYDFYCEQDSGISAFNMGDTKTTRICDFTASNEVVNMINFIGELEDGKIVMANSSGDECILSTLTKVDPSAIQDKEIITLGTVYIEDSIRKQIVKFNKKSDKYKINVIDYAQLAGEDTSDDDTTDEYMTGINKLSLDITQGKAPDIIVFENDMPFESYANKGALEPLDPYFEADSDIEAADYLSNILDATKVKGSMYAIIPSFNIQTCVVASDNAGGEVITLDNYKDVCARCGIDPEIGMGMVTRDDARELYQTIGSAYVNYEEGTCSFDSESFVKFLEFIKELPEYSEDMDYEEYESYYRENKSLLKGYWLGSFEDYQVLKKGYFGKDIEFNGYPTTKDGKSYIYPSVQIGMSSDCKNKQAVWEFMKSFLTDEYQSNISWNFPIEKKALDALAAKAQEKPYYLDANGKKVEHSSIWSIGGTDVEIAELSKEETQTVVDFIESVTDTESTDDNVINIIAEEAAAFYEGQKTAEEVADIIQSRVSIYLSEQM
ncbi:ABC transporter substrate-binding protein [Butyrivibrio sp. XPD2002]|uniref:ABC transporter substrate-binding protein n=1 Tax=Butyrivibrio sp. XPD2002 TaxID=1280665 RepID=UPI0004045C3D|nr:extracellular solute-binding protein [Butyrivibrio sp. XPD2002]